ncbi:MAG TPA: glycosyltransferase family 39 protein, partial [Armatimonadota bacterium]|nr:glycosyltransferase family 39 protein [Armatimonadota bacterium]
MKQSKLPSEIGKVRRSPFFWVCLIGIAVLCAVVTFISGTEYEELTGLARLLCLVVLLCSLAAYRFSPPSTSGMPSRLLDTAPTGLIAGAIGIGIALLATSLALSFPVHLYDEGIWSYIAGAWVHFHHLPYIDAVENKTPGIFYLFALGQYLPGPDYLLPRLAGVVANIIAAWGIYRLGCRLRDRFTGLLAFILYGFATLFLAFEGHFTSATETFMLACSIWAAVCIFTAAQASSRRRYFLLLASAGALCGLAITFKQIAIMTTGGLFFAYLWQPSPFRKSRTAVLRDTSIMAGALLATHLISLIPLLLSGISFGAYWDGAWRILAHAGSSVPDPSKRISKFLYIMESGELQLFLPLLLFFTVWRGKVADRPIVIGLVWWFVCDALGALLPGNYFGHQLRQLLPALCLLSALTIRTLTGIDISRSHQPVQATAWLVVASIAALWLPPLRFVEKEDVKQSYCKCMQQVAAYLQTHTSPAEMIYIFNSDRGTPILANAHRLAASRYFTQFFAE